MLKIAASDNEYYNTSGELKFFIVDDSMAPMIEKGSILIVDKSIQEPGRILVLVHDGKIIARKVRRLADGGFEIIPDNPEYPSYRAEIIHPLGAVIATARIAF